MWQVLCLGKSSWCSREWLAVAETLTCGKLGGAYFGAAESCCMPKALNARAMLGVACYMSE